MALKSANTQEALSRKYPESIALAGVADENSKGNFIPLGWFMQTSHEPPMLAISIGKTRYSHQLLEKAGEFTLGLPGENMEEEVRYCGTHSGRDVNKIDKLGIEIMPAKKINAPHAAKCVASFECRLTASIESGDHTIFTGEIVNAYISKENSKKLYTLCHLKFGGL